MTEKLLQEIFSRHLGDSSISGEAMTAFESRMEEFVRLSQVLERSEQSVQEQASEINALQAKETDCDDAISRQQKAQWELEKRLDHLAHCKDQTESLKQVLAENDRIREEITAIDLALETMTKLSATIRDSFGLYLNKTASELISGITGGIYDSMSVDESLNVFMNTRTRLVPVEQVSSGTMDQIYLALRLAAAKLIQPEGDYMPLIFDDSFVLYDEDRLHTALKWLKKAYPGQIIIFTCHQREAQLLTEKTGLEILIIIVFATGVNWMKSEKNEIRLLEVNEIECRIGTINENGLSLLLYKDARVDQKILDECYSPCGWKRSHQEIGGNLYCTVEVWDKEKQQWIAKQDVDTESYTEKEKGQASDSFKRACVNWGIGRELYSAPFIWIPAEKAAIRYDGKRYTTSEHFRVSAIGYDSGREINALEICNSKGFTVFRMQAKKEASAPKKMKNMPEEVKAQLSEKMRADLQKELNRTGIPVEQVLARYHLDDISQMKPEHYRDAMSGLKKSKPIVAA